MSDTVEKLQSMLVDQTGIATTEIDPDTPLQYFGMDAIGLEKLRLLIEESHKINMSVMVEEHYDINTNMPVLNLKDQTLRQFAGWVDDWFSRDVIHSRFRGRLTKPS
jgi:hypothetical protein